MKCKKCGGTVRWIDFNNAKGKCLGKCKGVIIYHSEKRLKEVGWLGKKPNSIKQ